MKKLIATLLAALCFVVAAPHSNAAVRNFVTDYGGNGDGHTDNRDALEKAFNTIPQGDTLYIPAGKYNFVLTPRAIWATPHLVVKGDGPSTILNLTSDQTGGDYREFLRPFGDDFTVTDLTVNRGDSTNMVIFPVTPHDGFTVTNCNIVGNVNAYGGYCHAFAIGLRGTTTNITLDGDTIADCSFGVIQSTPGNTRHIVVDNCHFSNNHGDDLGFNDPSIFNTQCSDVTVSNCTFLDNRSTSTSGGFAVAFAHVDDGSVTHCYITNYYNEGIHVEDYCNGISITHNNLINVGNGIAAPYCMTIATGSQNVTVDSNMVNARANTQPNLLMLVAVGNQNQLPQHVTVTNNKFIDGRGKHVGFYIQPGVTNRVGGNQLR